MTNTVTLMLGGSVELLLRQAPAEPEIACVVEARFQGFTATAKGFQMAYTLPADKMISVRVDYVDAGGHPATVDGPVNWDTSAADVVSIEVIDPNSQECKLTPGGTLGTAQISVTADADLGTGVRSLVTTLDVTVVAGEAVAGTISPVGEPQPIP